MSFAENTLSPNLWIAHFFHFWRLIILLSSNANIFFYTIILYPHAVPQDTNEYFSMNGLLLFILSKFFFILFISTIILKFRVTGANTNLWILNIWEFLWKMLLSGVQLFVTLWTVACQAPLSMEFFRQEYWNGLPCPSPGDLPSPGPEPGSPSLQVDSLSSEPPGKPLPSIFCIVLPHDCCTNLLSGNAGL